MLCFIIGSFHSTSEAVSPAPSPSQGEPTLDVRPSTSSCDADEMPVPIKTNRRKKDRQEMDSGIENALKGLIQQHKRRWEDMEKAMQEPLVKDGDELFFQSCSERIKRLCPQFRSCLKMQISQLFFNAENPDLIQVPIMPLPSQLTATLSTALINEL